MTQQHTPSTPETTEIPAAGLNRRSFLGRGLALTGASMFSSLVAMQQFAESAAAQDGGDDYKALVCVFFFGGNDGFNTLIPTHPGELATYQTARGTLALEGPGASDARRGPYLPLAVSPTSPNATNANDGADRTFALHPAMSDMQALFDAGAVSFVSNVGNLSEPITKAEYDLVVNGESSKLVPKALFSHSDQQTQWRNAEPNMAVPDGWAGRFPDELSDLNLGSIPMRISLNGNTNWLANQGEGSYIISTGGSKSLAGNDSTDGRSVERIRFEAQVGGSLVGIPENLTFDAAPQTNVLKQYYNSQVRQTVDLHDEFSAQFAPSLAQLESGLSDPMDANDLEARFKAVAATIAASQGLQMKRQIFFLGMGGFDTHSKQLTDHNALLGMVSSAMGKFWDALGVVGAQDQVVTFTASEFGRTLRRNGSGTDHAWGSNHWVMGGPVDGSKIFGEYPENLALGGPHDIENNGRVLPTTPVDAYGGELARWFGVSAGDMSAVFPNASRFYDVATTQHPVGFLDETQVAAEDTVEVVQSCFGTPSRGRFDVYVTNNGTQESTYSLKLTGLSARTVIAQPGETKVTTYTARRDGFYTVEVTRSPDAAPFYVKADMQVDCFVPVPWVLASSCLSGRGRFDLWIENETDALADFEIIYRHDDRQIERIRTIDAGEIVKETITGRQYGTWDMRVTNLTTGEEVFGGSADVLCGLPNTEAVIRRSCMLSAPAGFRGRVDVDLWNNSDSDTRTYEVRISRADPPFIGEQVRTVTLAPGDRATSTVTGRPNLDHNVVAADVTGGGSRILDTSRVSFNC